MKLDGKIRLQLQEYETKNHPWVPSRERSWYKLVETSQRGRKGRDPGMRKELTGKQTKKKMEKQKGNSKSGRKPPEFKHTSLQRTR